MNGETEPKKRPEFLWDDFHASSVRDGSASIEKSDQFRPVIWHRLRGRLLLRRCHEVFETRINGLLSDVHRICGELEQVREHVVAENE